MDSADADVCGGILSALNTLKKHEGAVGRDLTQAHWVWDDVGESLPFTQFVHFVVYAPPGSGIFHAVNEGYGIPEHHLTTMVELLSWLAWTKTKSAQEGDQPPDFSLPRPGKVAPQPDSVMTIGDYMKLAGLEG